MKIFFKVAYKLIHSLCLSIVKDRTDFIIQWTHWCFETFKVILISICMILVPSSKWEGLARPILSHELLQSIRSPNVKKAEEGHHGEPMGCRIEIACAIVSMEGKHHAYHDPPLYGFVSSLKLEEGLHLKWIVSSLLGWVIFEIVFIRVFVVPDVFSPELVDLSHLLWIGFCSFIKIVRKRLLLSASWWSFSCWMTCYLRAKVWLVESWWVYIRCLRHYW